LIQLYSDCCGAIMNRDYAAIELGAELLHLRFESIAEITKPSQGGFLEASQIFAEFLSQAARLIVAGFVDLF